MRTTLNLDDELMQRLRWRAVETKRTLTQLIEEALRDALEEDPGLQPPYRLRWKTARGRLRAAVDLNDRDSLIDRMEGRT